MGAILSDDRLRAMYAGGRANRAARRLARLWAAVFQLGLMPSRWVTLEVPGRRSGRVTRFPLGMADWNGQRYLVPMLGERCNWVQNVQAANGAAAATSAGATPAQVRAGHTRRRHWWRWILGGAVVLVAVIVAVSGLVFKLQPSPAALALPTHATSAPGGPLDGTWDVAPGSLAGFRVRETALGLSNDTVGRTSDVNGAVVISGDTVTSATFRVNLTTLKVGGKRQPQFVESLSTASHPFAVLTLARPVSLSPGFASGATITARAAADFAMNGVSRRVTVTFSARRDGPGLQAAGSVPVAFSGWGIRGPAGFGFLASLASHGSAEFFLVLHYS